MDQETINEINEIIKQNKIYLTTLELQVNVITREDYLKNVNRLISNNKQLMNLTAKFILTPAKD